jgi:hypothetical protein
MLEFEALVEDAPNTKQSHHTTALISYGAMRRRVKSS